MFGKLTQGCLKPNEAKLQVVGAAVRAEEIGRSMFEVTARGGEFENGDKVSTRGILRYSDAFSRRIGL